jgi:ketosteroid isomerase-like protein
LSAGNAAVLRSHFEAIDRGGLAAGAEYWHPDIDWRAIEGALDDRGVIHGRDAMLRYYHEWLDTLSDIRTEVDEVLLDEGDLVVAVLRVSSRVRGSDIPAQSRYFLTCTIRDGLIVRGREHATAAEALAAAREPD